MPYTFLPDGNFHVKESGQDRTRDPWLMLLIRRNQPPTKTLCWGLTNAGTAFARIGTQEGDLINGFVQEDPYKVRPLGPYIYFTGEEGGSFSNTWAPIYKNDQQLETEYDFGSMIYRTEYQGLSVSTECFIPDEADAMLQLVTVKNTSGKRCRWTLHQVNPVNIGDARDIQFSGFNTLMMGGGRYDEERDALVWRSHYGIPFSDDSEVVKGMFGKVLIHTTSEGCAEYACRYEDFVGHYSRSMANPEALETQRLSCLDAEDLTSALSTVKIELELDSGESKTLVFGMLAVSTQDYFGKQAELNRGMELLRNPAAARASLEQVRAAWKRELDKVQVQVPSLPDLEPSFRWLEYQCTMVAALNRMKSRFHSGFEYGYGFRDILQDLLALLPTRSDEARGMLLFTGKQMFSDGSVYHNFFVSAPGTRDFKASDDPLWFVLAVCEYIRETGDFSFLDVDLEYADAREGMPAASGSVEDHCRKALLRVDSLAPEGLPILFDADWNDDLSGYPDHRSVMTAEIFYKALEEYRELMDRSERKFPEQLAGRAEDIRRIFYQRCIDREGRIIRLVGDSVDRGSDVGAAESDGLTFFEPTAWAGYSGIVDEETFNQARKWVVEALEGPQGISICPADTTLARGELPKVDSAWTRNAPGKKENGGAFRHLESWYMASLCEFGRGKEACDLYFRTLPYVCSRKDAQTYAAEPFVYPEYVAAPISAEAGRAGHTWLTGTAPTRFRVLLESILGLQADYDGLKIDPCIDPDWTHFSAWRSFRGTDFRFRFYNPDQVSRGVRIISVDGTSLPENKIPAALCDGGTHEVVVEMGGTRG